MAEKKNGKRMSEEERLSQELEKVNTRITQQTHWMRALSNDLRRLGEKLYGLTEGTVTLADAKLPAGRYRTPDQTALSSADIQKAAERMVQVKRRFVRMESDLAAADDLRAQMEKREARGLRRKKAS
jgi:hypothetical protein